MTLGAVVHVDDRAALMDGATRAGAVDVVELLPNGWDTVLARQYTDGVVLAGGRIVEMGSLSELVETG